MRPRHRSFEDQGEFRWNTNVVMEQGSDLINIILGSSVLKKFSRCTWRNILEALIQTEARIAWTIVMVQEGVGCDGGRSEWKSISKEFFFILKNNGELITLQASWILQKMKSETWLQELEKALNM